MGKQIEIERIRIDGGTQMREHIDYHAVADYAEAYRAGVDMPELVVFHDGSDYWLADGFHRWHAAKKADKPKVTCHVRSGSQREAILYAAGANDANGLRRTPEDKMIAVRRLLLDDEWGKRSDRWIAEHARVSNHFVAEQRKQMPQLTIGNSPNGKTGKTLCKDGREYPAKRITRKPSVAPHVPPIDEEPVSTVPQCIIDRTEEEWEAFHVREKCMEARQMVRDLMEMRDRLDAFEFVPTKASRLINDASNIIAEAIQSAEEAA